VAYVNGGAEERAGVRAETFEGLPTQEETHCKWCFENKGGERHVVVYSAWPRKKRMEMLRNVTSPLQVEWDTQRWSIQKEILLSVGADYGCEK
jgi:hypothetical protein